MPPRHVLPIDSSFLNSEDYIDSLLNFVTSHSLFQTLCGGVHILDFLTRDADLYDTVIPVEWRDWFESQDISSIIHLVLREDVHHLEHARDVRGDHSSVGKDAGSTLPPQDFLDYIITIRRHSLNRDFSPARGLSCVPNLPRPTTVGMKPKKVHEVQNFAAYINALSQYLSDSQRTPSHIVDFGSGQNYLGRALASPPYGKSVIALESKHHNIGGAQAMDVHAKIAEKQKTIRNKKAYRSQSQHLQCLSQGDDDSQPPFNGLVKYVETMIKDGDLRSIVEDVELSHEGNSNEPQLLVISLHSCGNLLHHGLRSIVMNHSVKAVALIGCCYNLMTERLGPPTFKIPSLRSPSRRLDQTSSACDPHGFPMSTRMVEHPHKHGKGLRFNITARMMACQAPQNWTRQDCESFFTRHFYRALLQRILLDRGIVSKPVEMGKNEADTTDGEGPIDSGPAITIGSLRKSCYTSFVTYVRCALVKLAADPDHRGRVTEALVDLTDAEIEHYEEIYAPRRKDLGILWTLMAFSATLVESVIVADRWLYLKEQPIIAECRVEPVFEYQQSPRNLVVVGIKK